MPKAYDEICAVSGLPIAKGERVMVTLVDTDVQDWLPGRPGHIAIGLPFGCAYDGEGWFDGVDVGFPGSANLGALANAAETYVMPSRDPSPSGDWETFSSMARERQDREIEPQLGVMVVRADVHAMMLRSGGPEDLTVDARAVAFAQALSAQLKDMRSAAEVGRGGRRTGGVQDLLEDVGAGRFTTQFLAWLEQAPEMMGPEGDDAALVGLVVAADAFERASDLLGVELVPSMRLRAGVDWDRVADLQDAIAGLRAETAAPAP